MSAIAAGRGCRARGSRTSFAVRAAFALVAIFSTTRAAADVGATVSVLSDERFRGYSLSGGSPVAALDFAYDDASGFYADASGTGVLRHGDPALLGFELNGGFAKRLKSGTTIDVGLTGSSYSYYSNGGPRKSYAELYAGIARGALSTRIFLSPHYSESGLWTAYGEVNGSISPARDWSLDGHVGLLVPIRTPHNDERYRTAFDWRAGVTRQLGRITLHAAWVQGARGANYYGSQRNSTHALVLGATLGL